jgi:hypothetical protein
MGTRINVLLEHDLPDYRNRELVLARLAPALPATLAVRDYWRVTDPETPQDELAAWRAEPELPRGSGLLHFTAPGSLFLTVAQHVAHIRTGGRWRGFLSIEPLRRIHLAAFRRIAAALGSHCMALYPDSCEVDDLFWGGWGHWECVQLLERMWGPPQHSVEEIDPAIDVEGMAVFSVWFLEGS